jgi:hypothetical protein
LGSFSSSDSDPLSSVSSGGGGAADGVLAGLRRAAARGSVALLALPLRLWSPPPLPDDLARTDAAAVEAAFRSAAEDAFWRFCEEDEAPVEDAEAGDGVTEDLLEEGRGVALLPAARGEGALGWLRSLEPVEQRRAGARRRSLESRSSSSAILGRTSDAG